MATWLDEEKDTGVFSIVLQEMQLHLKPYLTDSPQSETVKQSNRIVC